MFYSEFFCIKFLIEYSYSEKVLETCTVRVYHLTSECVVCLQILKLLMGKVVIGHAIHNDFKALGYAHPAALTRDTSRIPLLNQKAGFADNECASLKRLTKAIFNRDIQVGESLSSQ